ncbi:MAG: AAA family ATPase, partial [Deltaproteobacteria bacterium]|nr:AAA family ATPase [Deltaproteobacteria bacterium]
FAIRSYASNPRPRPILLVGPPGVGKTMFANAVSQALEVPKILLSLGNMFDKSLLKGFNSTWRSATSGMIFQSILTAGCINPVIILDEIDKAGSWEGTGRIIDICCELLEPESAARFVDDYYEIPFDLSAAMFFLTANAIEMVPDYVIDRCMVVSIPDYTREERAYILKYYTCRQIIEEQALSINIEISDDFALGLATATRSLRAARKTILRHIGQHLLSIRGIVVEQILLKRVEPRLVVMASAAKRPARF